MKKLMPFLSTAVIIISVITMASYSWSSFLQHSTTIFDGEKNSQSINLICRDETTKSGLSGCLFELHDNDKVVGRYLTDENGKILVNSLQNDKQYHFKEVSLPFGYTSQNDTVYFNAGQSDIIIDRAIKSPPPFPLVITNTILDKDFYSQNYTPTEEDLSFPFEFVVTIGSDYDTMYEYEIRDTANNFITPYTYRYEDGRNITVNQTGAINSGSTVYLRSGETIYFSNNNLTYLTHYNVSQRNYCNMFLSDSSANDHYEVIGNMNGWQSSGNNTFGQIDVDGTKVSFTNRRINERTDITMSSLSVVNRISQSPQNYDYTQSFKTKIIIGEDLKQRYYYEIVHTNEVAEYMPSYNYNFDYYYRNDPYQNDRIITNKSKASYINENPMSGSADYIYYPKDFERFKQQDNITNGELLLSDNNEITAELYHNSAIIIYGIPVGSHYNVSQEHDDKSGYSILNTIKTEGIVQPDLERLANDLSEMLLRTRADIVNTKTAEKTTDISVSLKTSDSSNPTTTPLNIQLIDIKTGLQYKSASVPLNSQAETTFILPKYDPATLSLIDYGIKADFPEGYKIKSYDINNNKISINIAYSPDTLQLGVRSILNGVPATDEHFTYSIKATAPNTPLPPYTTNISLKNAVIAFFNEIKFLPKGVNGKRYYEYEISQKPGNAAGFSYDDTLYKVNVEVTEKNNVCAVKIANVNAGLCKDGVFFFENTYKKYNQADTAKLTVRKIVEAAPNTEKEKDRKFNFEVKIGNEEHIFSLKHGETKTFDDIPLGTKYSVFEETTKGYKQEAFGNKGTIEENGSIATFINTYTPAEEIKTGKLTLYKELDGEDAEIDKDFRFTVLLDGVRHIVYLKGGEYATFDNIEIGTRYAILEKDYSDDGYITQSYNSGGKIKQGSNSVLFINKKIPIIKAPLIVTNEVLTGDVNKTFDYTAIIGDEAYEFSLTDMQSKTFENIPVNTPYTVFQKDYSYDGYTTKAFADSGIIIEGGVFARFINTKADYEIAEPPSQPTSSDNIPQGSQETQNAPASSNASSCQPTDNNKLIDNPQPPKATPHFNNTASILMSILTPILLILWLAMPRYEKIKKAVIDLLETLIKKS